MEKEEQVTEQKYPHYWSRVGVWVLGRDKRKGRLMSYHPVDRCSDCWNWERNKPGLKGVDKLGNRLKGSEGYCCNRDKTTSWKDWCKGFFRRPSNIEET